MDLQVPSIPRHPVSVLTSHFHITGHLEASGMVLGFINDSARDGLSLYDAHLAPLVAAGPLREFSHPRVVIRKSQIGLLYFAAAETRASIRTLRRRELLVAYTPVAVCRGYFHMPAEANVHDFLNLVAGDLLPVTEANIFPLVELPAPFPTEADLVMVGRSHLQFYYTA